MMVFHVVAADKEGKRVEFLARATRPGITADDELRIRRNFVETIQRNGGRVIKIERKEEQQPNE